MYLPSLGRAVPAAAGLFAALILLSAAPADEATRITAAGRALLDKQQWVGASAEFERAIRLAPSNASAHLGLSLAKRGAGEPDAAIAEAKTALRLRPAYPEARIALGLLLQQKGDVDGAIAQYQLLLKSERSAEAHNWLGVAYMQKNRLREAVAEFRAALQINPQMIRAYNNLGSTLAQAGEITGAIAAFRDGLKRAPDDPQLRLNYATALRTSGDSEGAGAELRALVQREPANPELRYQLALALRERGEREAAVGEFETALNLNPEYQDAYYALGQTLQQLASARKRGAAPLAGEAAEALKRGLLLAHHRDLPGAVEQLSRAAALRPDSADVQFHLGAALWYSGEKRKAAEALDEALRLDPAAGPAYSLRGVASRDAGDLAGAQRMFVRAIALNPGVPGGYLDLGVVFLRRQELNHALGQFEAGLNLPAVAGPPPDIEVAVRELRAALSGHQNAEGFNVLGRMLGLAGADAHEVITAFESAVRIKPDLAEAHNNLGLVYTQTGDDNKAIAEFREAIRLQPGLADAHANLGAVITATDADGAVRELQKALELQPGLLKARYNLAIAFGSSAKHGPDKEIAELRKLLAVQADYPRAEFVLGKTLLRKGSVADAIPQLERAVKAEPEFGEARYQLGLALSRAGRTGEAAKWLKQGRELVAESQRDQQVLLDLSEGKEALGKGEIDQAVAKFRSAVRQQPGLAEAQYQLGAALARKRDLDAAGEALRTALRLDPAHAAAQHMLEELRQDDPARIAVFEDHIRAGQFSEAQQKLEAYLKERPQSARAWYILGYSLFGQRKIGESISALAKSLALDVTNAEAHKVLGRNLMIIGRFSEAQKEFEIGEKYAPASAEIPFNLGRLFSIQDQWPDAKAAFERALKLDREYMQAWDGLGFALEALGDDAGAVAGYQKAAKLNEQRNAGFATPYVNLSAYFNRKGDADTALEYARKAVAVNANSDGAWFQMARASEQRGELEAAVTALNRAIRINARSSSYHYVLASIYRRLGRAKESRDAMETFSKLNRESNELEKMRRDALRLDASVNE